MKIFGMEFGRKKKELEEKVRLVISFSMYGGDKKAPYCVRKETSLHKNQSFANHSGLASYVVAHYSNFEIIKYEHMPSDSESFLKTYFTQHSTKMQKTAKK